MNIYSTIKTGMEANKKFFAVLIDPDDTDSNGIHHILKLAKSVHVDFFFIGGSLITKSNFSSVIQQIRKHTNVPAVIFPGSMFQIDNQADAILLLSLISGRNPEYLIGQHVQAAPHLKNSNLEVISTGYMLIDGGNTSTAQYISNTIPIPPGKKDIAGSTALAGELLGNQVIYLDAGSGATHPVPPTLISEVKTQIKLPLIVGGGIKTPMQLREAYKAGADVAVIGNALEKDPSLLKSFSESLKASE
ncbi:MAG: geranylgeranylglyceryl/heptaprenylglyceryl phosphate synthase [Bacteroidales bacterium]|nr:geranylgeranylglyceryl/heptaprenylglyceryl phosphate synthase [Bacteroidales bacterium]